MLAIGTGAAVIFPDISLNARLSYPCLCLNSLASNQGQNMLVCACAGRPVHDMIIQCAFGNY